LDAVPKQILIYVLSGYVLLQFVWWAFMLVDLNNEAYHLRLEMLSSSAMPSPEAQIQKSILDEKTFSTYLDGFGGRCSICFLSLFLDLGRFSAVFQGSWSWPHNKKNFLLSVTHELKSPLAAIKLQLQTLAGRELPEQKRKQIYNRALSDTERLQGLVENLLLVNRVEAGKLPLNMSKLDVSALLEAICQRHFPSQLENETIVLKLVPSIYGMCDAEAMQSIILNLTENAIKYGAQSVIEIGVSQTDVEIIIHVSDAGPGIPDSEKERIFSTLFSVRQ
jgi:two-component system phosphate regulon sensor histidine kinase PhoR